MRTFAQDLSATVQNIRALDSVAVKIASAEGSLETQMLKAAASSELYGVMEKTAEEQFPGHSPSDQMLLLVEKVAAWNNKAPISGEARLKIAAAVLADTALTSVIRDSDDQTEREKLAESRAFGREFFLELIGEVI